MAKGKSTASGVKMNFGKKSSGKLNKKFGQKEERPKKYRGQGR